MSDKLKVNWSKKENDFMVTYPRKPDGHLISNFLLGDNMQWGGIDGKDKGWMNYKMFNLINELKSRGYDIKTLKFEIKLEENEQKHPDVA